MPINQEDMNDPSRYQLGVFCPYCVDSLSEEKKVASSARQLQMDLARSKGIDHLGFKKVKKANRKRQGSKDLEKEDGNCSDYSDTNNCTNNQENSTISADSANSCN
jgi:hypothetical protein